VRELTAKLDRFPGPVLMQAHPLYGYLRDGTICAHVMGLRDLTHAGGVPDVDRRIASGEFATVVVDTSGRRPDKRHFQLALELSFKGRTLLPVTGYPVRPKTVYVHRSQR
jgi:hypothetical protein